MNDSILFRLTMTDNNTVYKGEELPNQPGLTVQNAVDTDTIGPNLPEAIMEHIINENQKYYGEGGLDK